MSGGKGKFVPVVYGAICARCPKTIVVSALDMTEAHKEAVKHNWILTSEGLLCPKCRKQ